MLTFKQSITPTHIAVFLDNVRVGTIKPMKTGGYAYYPKNCKTPGETLPTVNAVKISLRK